MSTRSSALLSVVIALWPAATAFAHDSDPKALDKQPIYRGPGYRAGQGGGGIAAGFPSSNMTLLAWLPIPEFGTHDNGNDCWGYVSPSGREYALMGLSHGTGFVEITNPANPVILDVIAGIGSLWRDVKVYQHYAYVVTEGGGGIQIVDMADIDNGNVTLLGTVNTPGTGATHNVAIDTASGFLYRCGGGGNGLRIYDLSDPENPTWVASWSERYVHDVQVHTYTSGPYAGRQVAFASSGLNSGWTQTGVDVLDVTDKQNILQLDRLVYANGEYSHQAWLSEDGRYLYHDDELDEGNQNINTTTRVFDVQNLSNISVVATFANSSPAIGHNLYTHNGLLFEANYRSGLRVFDVTADPLNPPEIAYFDTYPENDAKNYNGLWSNYPYFPSGTIIGSDMERGLFVLKLDSLFSSGDLNCDGLIDAFDIEPFITALVDPNGYPGAYPNCDIELADINGDGTIDGFDIEPFIALILP